MPILRSTDPAHYSFLVKEKPASINARKKPFPNAEMQRIECYREMRDVVCIVELVGVWVCVLWRVCWCRGGIFVS
jgi:hypothetical protein